MAGFSYPFDSGPGSAITEDQWSYLMKDAVGTGVHENGAPGPNGTELKAFSLAEPGIIYVNSGRASIDGFHYQQSGTEIVAVTTNGHVTQSRVDALILRLDLTSNTIALEAKLGTPAVTPVPPAILANELLLATYTVPPNTSTVPSNEVVDKRRFVGRRVVTTNDGTEGSEGDLQYSPGLERWMAVKPAGFKEALAFQSEIIDHEGEIDPHPQYLTQAEAFPTVTASTLSYSPTVSVQASYCRSINLPGGFRIVNVYFFGQFNGADNPGAFTLFTINDAAMRPNSRFRFVGHQYKFSNSTDDMPLVVSVNTDGSVQAGGDTWLQGGAVVLFNGIYFKGDGL